MKKYIQFSLLTMLMLVLAAACTEEEIAKTTTVDIIGTWSLTGEAYSNCVNPGDNGVDTFTCTATDCNKRTFNADGTYVSESISAGVSSTESGTYTLSGNSLELFGVHGSGVLITVLVTGNILVMTFEKNVDLGYDCTRAESYSK